MDSKQGSSTVDNAAASARQAAESAANKVTDAVTGAKEAVVGTVESAASRANAVADWTAQKIETVRNTPNQLVDAGAEHLRTRPYQYVFGAFLIGYLLGRMGRN